MSDKLKTNLIIIFVLLLLFAAIAAVEFLTAILAMLGGALIVTYILLGPVNLTQQLLERGAGKALNKPFDGRLRVWAVLLIYLVFLGIITIAMVRAAPKLSNQLQDFASDLPGYLDRVQERVDAAAIPQSDLLESLLSVLPPPTEPADPAQTAPIISPDEGSPTATETTVTQLGDTIRDYAAILLGYLVNVGATTVSTLIYTLTALVLIFYMLLDGKGLKNGFVNLLPERFEPAMTHYLETIHRVLYDFIRIQVFMAILAGLYLYIILQVFGVEKYAFFLAFFFGTASIIPVLGPLFSILPITVVVLLLSSHPVATIPVLMCIAIFYLLKVYWILPRLMRYDFDIHPVVIIMTFLICLQTADVAGVLLAFPLASLFSGTYEYLVQLKTRKA